MPTKRNFKFERGVFTLGSTYEGWAFQVYWPTLRREWADNKSGKTFLCGINFQARTALRLTISPYEPHYAIGFNVVGVGIGIQYLRPLQQ